MNKARLSLCDLGGIILAEGLHDWGKQVMPFFFSYMLAFALKLRKITEKLSQGNWLVLQSIWLPFAGQLQLACRASVLLHSPWVISTCPWLAQAPSKLPN
jgi:hypothetical protein